MCASSSMIKYHPAIPRSVHLVYQLQSMSTEQFKAGVDWLLVLLHWDGIFTYVLMLIVCIADDEVVVVNAHDTITNTVQTYKEHGVPG